MGGGDAAARGARLRALGAPPVRTPAAPLPHGRPHSAKQQCFKTHRNFKPHRNAAGDARTLGGKRRRRRAVVIILIYVNDKRIKF